MNPLLRDFYNHQVWADAEHARAIAAHPPARDDRVIRSRLHHIALVQRGFLWTVTADTTPFAFTQPDDFPVFEDLQRYSREYHDAMRTFLATVSDARLEEPVAIPWFKDPPLTITVTEALTQCAMHSHYHRGQNATRLRELGGVPPPIDLIVWYWQGRPQPSWTT
jgi:uncharacterized damage-inducible protein DinB